MYVCMCCTSHIFRLACLFLIPRVKEMRTLPPAETRRVRASRADHRFLFLVGQGWLALFFRSGAFASCPGPISIDNLISSSPSRASERFSRVVACSAIRTWGDGDIFVGGSTSTTYLLRVCDESHHKTSDEYFKQTSNGKVERGGVRGALCRLGVLPRKFRHSSLQFCFFPPKISCVISQAHLHSRADDDDACANRPPHANLLCSNSSISRSTRNMCYPKYNRQGSAARFSACPLSAV